MEFLTQSLEVLTNSKLPTKIPTKKDFELKLRVETSQATGTCPAQFESTIKSKSKYYWWLRVG